MNQPIFAALVTFTVLLLSLHFGIGVSSQQKENLYNSKNRWRKTVAYAQYVFIQYIVITEH